MDLQYRTKKRISCLEEAGFAAAMQDESFFIHDIVTGRKYWALRGRRIHVPYTGSHKKITVYGSLARDDRQFFRTYERFDAPAFILYLKEALKHLERSR